MENAVHLSFIKFVSQALLDDGFSIGNVSQHHALDDAVVFLFWQIFVRHQWGVVFGSWRWVHPLKPCVALDLLQRCSPLRIPLKHSVYQAVKNIKWRRWGRTSKVSWTHELNSRHYSSLKPGLCRSLLETQDKFRVSSNIYRRKKCSVIFMLLLSSHVSMVKILTHWKLS